MIACTSKAPMGSPPAEGANPVSTSFRISRLVIVCELEHGHDGLHRSGPLTWHDPILLLVGGQEPDIVMNTDHWRDGKVVLSADREATDAG